ncbi:MAG: hypothetical protein OXC26_06810 [Albidovulum sp.]|nr:hypothetical protein [Albidovulum sp.]
MTGPELFGIIGSVLGVGVALAVMILHVTARLDRRIDEAGADRRAFQAAMDDFRKEMQKLAERQSRVEGRLEGAPGD